MKAGKTAFCSAGWMDAYLVASMEPLWAGRKAAGMVCEMAGIMVGDWVQMMVPASVAKMADQMV